MNLYEERDHKGNILASCNGNKEVDSFYHGSGRGKANGKGNVSHAYFYVECPYESLSGYIHASDVEHFHHVSKTSPTSKE